MATEDVKALMLQVDASTELARRNLYNLEKEISKFRTSTERELKQVDSRFESLGASASKFGTALQGLVGGALVAQIVQTNRSFQSMKVSLETATGSAEKAEAVFGALQKFAASTPYTLDQVVEGFIKLKNMGLDPSIKALTSYGNTSGALGKSLNDMIEAVADAATGEFERLKEFGIRAKSEGDKVTFTFQGVSTTVRKEAGAIEGYLQSLGNVNFAGGMDKQAKTLDGSLSNLSDSFAQLMVAFGEGGFNSAVADMAKSMGDGAGNAQSFASQIGSLAGQIIRAGQSVAQWLSDNPAAAGVLFGSAAGARVAGTPGALIGGATGGLAGWVNQAPNVSDLKAQLARVERDLAPMEDRAMRTGIWSDASKLLIARRSNLLRQIKAAEVKPNAPSAPSVDPTAGMGGGGGGGNSGETEEERKVRERAEKALEKERQRIAGIFENERLGRPSAAAQIFQTWNDGDGDKTVDLLKQGSEEIKAWNEAIVSTLDPFEHFPGILEEINGKLTESDRITGEFADDLTRGLGQAIIYGQSLGDALVSSIKAASAELISSGLMDMLLGGKGENGKRGGGILNSAFSSIGSLFGGPRASGGPVDPSKFYMVGERGPELFVPSARGTIIPNGGLGGGGVVVHQTISMPLAGNSVTPADLARAMTVTKQAAEEGAVRALTRTRLPGR